ncbi:hypothetical protein, partial [Aeromonas caviae]|uniref:hypothetical protein n=1 Tax=Aeromonas caviae TaxID=648 RepID=UPI001CC3B20C
QNITMVKQRVSTMFCTTGAEFQFWAKSAILPQNANSHLIKTICRGSKNWFLFAAQQRNVETEKFIYSSHN